LLDVGSGSASGRLVLEGLLVDAVLVEVDVDRVSGGHQVVGVHDAEEGLDLGALLQLLLAHALGHLARVTIDTGDQAVRVWSVSRALIVGLEKPSKKRETFTKLYLFIN
jgi:hypothetical protein